MSRKDGQQIILSGESPSGVSPYFARKKLYNRALLTFARKNCAHLTTMKDKQGLPFTKKEQEILDLLRSGMSNKAIAEDMGVSINTVKTHLKNLFRKLGVNNRTQAIIKAAEPQV